LNYDFYFEVFDNDAIHHFKSSRSTVFSSRILSDEEKQNNALQEQNNAINSLQKTLSKQDKQFSEMEKLQQTNKEKEGLNFNDRQKIQDFIKQQQLYFVYQGNLNYFDNNSLTSYTNIHRLNQVYRVSHRPNKSEGVGY